MYGSEGVNQEWSSCIYKERSQKSKWRTALASYSMFVHMQDSVDASTIAMLNAKAVFSLLRQRKVQDLAFIA